jgi:hypothetical protein
MTNMLSILIKNIHKWRNMVDDKGLHIPYTHPTFSCSCTDIDNFFFYEMDSGISKRCIFSPPYQKGHVITVSMVV